MGYDPGQPRDENNQKWSSFGGGSGGALDPKKAPGIQGVEARAKAALANHPKSASTGLSHTHLAGDGLVYTNPTGNQLLKFMDTRKFWHARGIVDAVTGDTHWADNMIGIHPDIANEMGVELYGRLAIDRTEVDSADLFFISKPDAMMKRAAERLAASGNIKVHPGGWE